MSVLSHFMELKTYSGIESLAAVASLGDAIINSREAGYQSTHILRRAVSATRQVLE